MSILIGITLSDRGPIPKAIFNLSQNTILKLIVNP